MSTSQIFAAGGIVMWPLLIFSIVTLILTIERLVFWTRVLRGQRPLMKKVLNIYRNHPNDVFSLLKQNLRFPAARIFLDALELEGASPNQFRLALEGATQAEIPLLKRFTGGFQTIVALSPLMGLLGTILGLIRSFANVNLGEVGANAQAVTGGISEALVSTAAGLVVAMTALLFANLFRSFYRRQLALLQEYGSQLEILYEWHYQNTIQEQSYHAHT
jgi:biopolymer transport protein ExbB